MRQKSRTMFGERPFLILRQLPRTRAWRKIRKTRSHTHFPHDCKLLRLKVIKILITRFKSRAATLVVNVENPRVILRAGSYSEARSVGRLDVCKRRTTDELSFTMGGDKMVSHWENILCRLRRRVGAWVSLRKVSILPRIAGFAKSD